MLDEAFEILRKIQGRGRLAVIVGGAVRDILLDRPLTDVDLATDMPLDELSTIFTTHAVGRSKTFETVVISRGGHAFEISRFRSGGPPRQPPADPRPPGKPSIRFARTPRTATSPSTLCSWDWTAASSIFKAASPIYATGWSVASARRRSASPKTPRVFCVPCGSPRDSISRSRRNRRGGRQGRAASGHGRGRTDRQGDPEAGFAAGHRTRRCRHLHGSVRDARAAPP